MLVDGLDQFLRISLWAAILSMISRSRPGIEVGAQHVGNHAPPAPEGPEMVMTGWVRACACFFPSLFGFQIPALNLHPRWIRC